MHDLLPKEAGEVMLRRPPPHDLSDFTAHQINPRWAFPKLDRHDRNAGARLAV